MVAKSTLYRSLVRNLQRMAPLAIACSGGLDSRLLCHVALLAGLKCIAIHIRGPHIPERDTSLTLAWAREEHLPLLSLDLDVLLLDEVRKNSKNRCYICKKNLFRSIRNTLATLHTGYTLCDGSNADDAKEYRPGRLATKEEKILSPFELTGIGKSEIRELARDLKLSRPDQAPSPCLLTRLAYGLTADKKLLAHLSRTEEQLIIFLTAEAKERHESVPSLRLRLTPDPVLQLTSFTEEMRKPLRQLLENAGYPRCRLHITQKISGFFDNPLPSSDELPEL
ncbi:MAG: PP-loop family protein [Desulfovibrio sp.]|nr:PP-loop family protein [Desulfovibrio sp.]